jgi:hypothetical protein
MKQQHSDVSDSWVPSTFLSFVLKKYRSILHHGTTLVLLVAVLTVSLVIELGVSTTVLFMADATIFFTRSKLTSSNVAMPVIPFAFVLIPLPPRCCCGSALLPLGWFVLMMNVQLFGSYGASTCIWFDTRIDVVPSFHATSPHAFNKRSNTACPIDDAFSHSNN